MRACRRQQKWMVVFSFPFAATWTGRLERVGEGDPRSTDTYNKIEQIAAVQGRGSSRKVKQIKGNSKELEESRREEHR
jgi:hypothetical protein